MLHTLGVDDLSTETAAAGEDEAAIDAKINERSTARTAKDWATSDRIRDELVELGIAIEDGPDGTTWKRMLKK